MRLRLLVLATLVSACARGGQPAAEPPAPAPESAPRVPPSAAPAPATPARDPVRPAFEIGIWPGEGIPVFESRGVQLTLREQPYPDARVSALVRIPAGERITYDASRYQTIAPVTVHVLAPTTLDGRRLGAIRLLTPEQYYSDNYPSSVTTFVQGARFELLQHRAEGTCFVRVSGQVIDAESCPTFDDQAFRVSGEPDTRWWIHIPGAPNASGWLLVTDTAVKQLDRTF
ncbi:MAG: hypothetical protein WD801_16840 [Gemmatimonadaceae bacterium]